MWFNDNGDSSQGIHSDLFPKHSSDRTGLVFRRSSLDFFELFVRQRRQKNGAHISHPPGSWSSTWSHVSTLSGFAS